MLLLIDYLLQQCSRRPPLHHCLKIDFSGVATWSTRSRSGAAAATGKAPFISACLLMTQNRNHGDKSADSNAKAQVLKKNNSSIHSRSPFILPSFFWRFSPWKLQQTVYHSKMLVKRGLCFRQEWKLIFLHFKHPLKALFSVVAAVADFLCLC